MVRGCISKHEKVILWITLSITVSSIVVMALFPTIYNIMLRKEIALSKGSLVTSIWEDIPLPVYEKLYFFNITNGKAFLEGTEPLNVTEVGPYVYRLKVVKNDANWNPNSTVSYREIRTYYFDPDLSNGTEEDLIFTLNGPLILGSALGKDYNINIRLLLSVLAGIQGDNIIIKRSIKEIAYGGYEDIIILLAPILKQGLPFKDGIFSWFAGKNATDDGLFTVFTGVDDPSKTNFINKWNGEGKLNFWKGDKCNSLNGTTIETGPPIASHQDSYTFFQSIVCRSLTFDYSEDKTHFDIIAKRFRPTYSIFANSTENPDNDCFEVEEERPSGVLDVRTCQFGTPSFLSFPHFYMADPSYLSFVNGLNPSDEKHGSYFDVEPISGFTINLIFRLQINVEISKVEGVFQTYNVTKGIFPVLWVELSVEIDEHFANFFKKKLRLPKIIAYSVLGVLLGVSFILSIVCFVTLCFRKNDNEIDARLLDAVDKDCDKTHDLKKYSKNDFCSKESQTEDCDLLEESLDFSYGTYSGNIQTRNN